MRETRAVPFNIYTNIYLISIILVFCFAGCSSTRLPISQLTGLYGNKFASLEVPDNSIIKKNGHNLSLLNTSFDKVWNAMIIVIMQKAPIVKVSKVNGLLVAPPYILHAVESQNEITLYVYFMDDLYKRLYIPSEDAIEVNPDDRERYLETTLGQIATQLQASEKLKSGGNWSYLQEGH